jgi:hypothetical protein
VRKYLLLLILILLPGLAFGQQKDATKMDKFISKTGRIIKFIDHNLPDIPTRYSPIESKVRIIEAGGDKKLFYQISKEGKYGDKVASIAEEDLSDLIKALQNLKQSVQADAQSKSDYLENKFVTEDGFQVGYYVSKGKIVWYITLERIGSDNTVFFNDVNAIENSFKKAQEKMRTLK